MKTIAAAAAAAALATCAALLLQAEPGSGVVAEAATPAAGPAPPAASAAAEPTPAAVSVSGKEAFNTECSACHMAYPPVMLPVRSWQAIVGDLADHFGEDASLDAETAQKIEEYLVANAAETSNQAQWILRGVGADQVPLRITEMSWWKRAHYEVSEAVFTRPDVMSKSNCLGCHRGGASGEAEDDD